MYRYTHFIKENIAPSGAKSIGVYDGNGKKIYTLPLGRMKPPSGEKLYSFGLVSDIHIQPWNASIGSLISSKLENALKWFEEQGAAFVCSTGDMVQRGFVNSSGNVVTDEFGEYKRICDLFPHLPIYELCGNHESMYADITGYLTELKAYTGNDLVYAIEQGDDLFLFIGQPKQLWVMSDEALQWLYEALEENRNKRCFVFIHSYIEEDSGDAKDLRENSIFEDWGTKKKTAFMNLMAHYKNAVLFHGHSHIKFESQELDKSANYTAKNGFKSVHIPSLGRPRSIDLASSSTPYADTEAQGYLVDVYEDCIVLNGMDLVGKNPVSLGIFKIDTTFQTITANTFTDSTGMITI